MPPIVLPRMPPIPVINQQYDIKSYDPCSGSFLACTHIIAADTTLTNASVIAATMRNIEMRKPLVSWRKYIEINEQN